MSLAFRLLTINLWNRFTICYQWTTFQICQLQVVHYKHNVGPSRLPDGSITVDPAVKATFLSQYFDPVYTVDNGDLPTTSTKATIYPALSSITFNSSIVFKTLKKLNVRSAGGPDHVPPIFLNKCLIQFLFYFSCILTIPFYPNRRQAYVTPVFKKVTPLRWAIIDQYLLDAHCVNLWNV